MSVSTTSIPATVDYKVVVSNDASPVSGPLYAGLLTDVLKDPAGAVMYTRSWNLDTVAPGDEITLTYSVAYATSTLPGIYHNTARVTGYKNASTVDRAHDATPVEAYGDVELDTHGQVLGVATSTASTTPAAVASVTGSCKPMLTGNLRRGSKSNKFMEVLQLQTFFNTQQGEHLLISGIYDLPTVAAVNRFQLKYADEILKPFKKTRPTGVVYQSTMRKLNILNCGGVDPLVTIPAVTVPVASIPKPSVPSANKKLRTTSVILPTSKKAPKKAPSPVTADALPVAAHDVVTRADPSNWLSRVTRGVFGR